MWTNGTDDAADADADDSRADGGSRNRGGRHCSSGGRSGRSSEEI
jgi:hypothetical protein